MSIAAVLLRAWNATLGREENIHSEGNRLAVVMGAGSEWIYGDWPQNSILPFTGAAGAADNDALYISGDVSAYSYHLIENRSGVAIDVHVTSDGTFNASQPAAAVLLTDDVTTGGGVKVVSIAANKSGILRGKFKKIRIDQAAAGSISAGAVVGFHGVE